MGKGSRVTNVPITAIGSGARLSDLIPLPLPVFVAIKLSVWLFHHWYYVLFVALAYYLHPLVSLLVALLFPLAFVLYIARHNRHIQPASAAMLRASWYVLQARRRWVGACHTGQLNSGPQVPTLLSFKRIFLPSALVPTRPPYIANPRGTAITFTVDMAKAGKTVQSLEEGQENVTAFLRARRSRVVRVTPGIAKLTIEWEKAPKASILSNPKDLIHSSQLPTIQLDQDVELELDTSLLVVGESGSGKSNLTWHMLNGLNENCIPYRLSVIDPKQIELADLQDGPNTIAYVDRAKDALPLVERFHHEMMERLSMMKAKKLRKIEISQEFPLNILVVDELLAMKNVLKGGDTDTPFGEILFMGRAAAYIVVANSQLGQKDVIGQIRDLFPQRACLATKSADLTNAVLGPQAEQRGAKCSEITLKGEGYMYTDSHGSFQRFRPPLITDTKSVAHPPNLY